jgi:hypothetical protein
MKKHYLSVLLLLFAQHAFARGMSAQEAVCLSQIKDETDFIISRINMVHKGYEEKVKQSGLAQYKSGDYSTIALLDNTIRKYHRKLVRKYKKYPFRYQKKVTASSHSGSTHCLAEQVRVESVGSIHEFELSWQRAFEQAQKNASYFTQVGDINGPKPAKTESPPE